MANFGLMDANVRINISMALTEEEARALYAITVYGADKFIETFKEHLGQSYLRGHEAGLRSLFGAAGSSIPQIMTQADRAREAFKEKK